MSPQKAPSKPTFPDSASPSSPIFPATRTKHSLNFLPRFADHFHRLAHNGLMIRFYPKTDQTSIAPPSLSVPRPAFFLTTNHYPLTTAFPAHTRSMIRFYPKTDQTSIAPPSLSVPRPAFFLTTNHYPLTTAFPAHTRSMIRFYPKTDQTRIAPSLPCSRVHDSRSTIHGSPSLCSLAPLLPCSLFFTHPYPQHPTPSPLPPGGASFPPLLPVPSLPCSLLLTHPPIQIPTHPPHACL